MNIFTQFFKTGTPEDRKHAITQDLMRREAALTTDIFGPVPQGTRREFFCLDASTWIWYEEWTGQDGHQNVVTTRYVIRPKEILKSQNGGAYSKLAPDEVRNFHKAIVSYEHRVKTQLYRKNPARA